MYYPAMPQYPEAQYCDDLYGEQHEFVPGAPIQYTNEIKRFSQLSVDENTTDKTAADE